MAINRHAIETRCQQQIAKAKKELHSFVVSLQSKQYKSSAASQSTVTPGKKRKDGPSNKKSSRSTSVSEVHKGQLLLIGGTDGQSIQQSIDVCKDLSSGFGWVSCARTITSRKCFAACYSSLHNQVWIIGGKHSGHCYTTEVWNLMDKDCETGPDMLEPRSNCAAALYKNLCFVFGGINTEGVLETVEMLDLDSKTPKWQRAHNMASPRMGSTACNFGSLLYVFGGHDGSRILNSVAALSPEVGGPGIWLGLPQMERARTGATCVVFEQHIWVIGGTGPDGLLSSTEILDPRESKWTHGPQLNHARSEATVAIFRGCIWVMGGNTKSGITDSVETLITSDKERTWRLGLRLKFPRASHAALAT
mmetsp:Transcript_19329/g.30222  ORF Transcript_19329/g.30222 Transcript_19329/m.30222 type:complete len:363 (+) Transcript_19329:987-2075(+)